MIVGRLPTQNGVLDCGKINGKGCVDNSIEYLQKGISDTYTDVVSKNGYFCALSNKCHFGYDCMAQHFLNTSTHNINFGAKYIMTPNGD